MLSTARRRFLIFFCFFIFAIFFYVGYHDFYTGEGESGISGDRTDLKVDNFPDFLEQSLQELEDRATEKKLEERGSGLSFWKRFSGETIAGSTPLIIRVIYQDSVLEEVVGIPEAFVGLKVEELASISGKWSVDSYSKGEGLVLKQTLESLPAEYENYQHLGINNGHVAIFYGREGADFLKQETGIDVNDLPSEEEKKLSDGIEVETEEELLTVLESLLSYKQD